MLFNSHIFIFLFLPVVLFGYYGLKKLASDDRLPLAWLLLVSLFFYGWWDSRYLLLLAFSVIVNFSIGRRIYLTKGHRKWLIIGVCFNLGLLAWFKYAGFILGSAGSLLGQQWTLTDIILPLAISFFTFQQIAWLVDVSKSDAKIPSFFNYALFVSFFPQLIAGPIVHHSEMMPQFENRGGKRQVFNVSDFNVGLTLFTLGLFKKVVLADQFALFANPVFSAAQSGVELNLLEAWSGTLSYTFQLYFDFSAYSDMAIGLARMMGIVLPLNFFSPYRAGNIRQFWQRWHITLSRFLRDYLYIPLGGNRSGTVGVSANILLTMLIGGLWHGAAWTFVAWGGLHGIYLLIHRWYSRRKGKNDNRGMGSVFVTFLAVTLAWVLFRAETFGSALIVYKGLFGFSGVSLTNSPYLQGLPELIWLSVAAGICFVMPNAYQFLASQKPALIPRNIELQQSRILWRDNTVWAAAMAALFIWSVTALNRVSEFLYFQF
jgi:alginate O-acetyltransferase complex protein AlgI